ncbi:MAG: 7-carboxy-7-deazaguanine synthase QueE [Chitinophagia bacterium]|nr:7-carboxy-7-deazaguanine synthase QueE [Chitinophagia bacterium]
MEHFHTLQGEGAYTGHSAYFIRLGGCNVGCTWCDVKESWDAHNHPLIHAETLAQTAKESGAHIAVITGGEPTLHHLAPLCDALHAQGMRIHIETSGTAPLTGNIDYITLSPKKFKAPLPAVFPLAGELKVVVYHPSDLEWAQTHAPKVSPHCKLYLQPEWSKKDKITPLIITFIKQHPQWQLSLQTHKYINIP